MIETKRERAKLMDNDYIFMLEVEKMKKDIDEMKNKTLPDLDRKVDKVESALDNKISGIDKKVDKMDQRLWAILVLLVAGLILPIVAKIYIAETPVITEPAKK